MIKLKLAELVTGLGIKLFELSQWLTLKGATLYGMEEMYRENDGLPPDDKLFFLLKMSDGRYNFHGIVAEDREDARKQAWKIPGMLVVLDSMWQFRLKLLSEAEKRTHERVERQGQAGAAPRGKAG